MTDDVYNAFKAILEDRVPPKHEKFIEGYSRFLFTDKAGLPLVAMHWEHRFNSMVNRYNQIYRVQIPNITPHVCRHIYCSNMDRAGMNPKTLQYLIGHSDISITMNTYTHYFSYNVFFFVVNISITINTYTHLGLDDAKDEMIRLKELEEARREVGKTTEKPKPANQNMFRAV